LTTLLTDQDARFILEQVAIPELLMEHGLTCRVLAAISEEMAERRPVEGARSIGELARHVVTAELRYLEGAAAGRFDEWGAAAESPSMDANLCDFRIRFARALERLRSLEGSALLLPLSYRGLIQMPALGFIRLALSHTIHHRGQISVFLRLLSVPVPRIYG
jgi:uncharacterized damage-inducible protein DinB